MKIILILINLFLMNVANAQTYSEIMQMIRNATLDTPLSGTVGVPGIATGGVTSTHILDGTILAADLNAMSATSGQVLKYNGSSWAAAADNTGSSSYVKMDSTRYYNTTTALTNTSTDVTNLSMALAANTWYDITIDFKYTISGLLGGLSSTLKYTGATYSSHGELKYGTSGVSLTPMPLALNVALTTANVVSLGTEYEGTVTYRIYTNSSGTVSFQVNKSNSNVLSTGSLSAYPSMRVEKIL